MADPIGPQGGGPRPHDGVPEIVDAPIDRQSRRYAHTLRRGGEPSGPVRAPDSAAAAGTSPGATVAPSALAHAAANAAANAADDAFDVATIQRAKPRPAEPPRAPEPPAPPAREHTTNRSSAPSDSTALYRKRTNPTMPTISPDLIARSAPADPGGGDPLSELDADAGSGSGDASRLPAVVLDNASHGVVVYPLALRRSPGRLILSLIAIALVAVAIWCFRSMF